MEELKNLVVETLDKNGSLDSIRAQLRGSVFSAIQSEQKKPLKTDANKLLESEIGEFSAELLRDFLDKSEASHTLQIFKQESQIKNESKHKLSKKFGNFPENVPGMFILIKNFKETFKPSEEKFKSEENSKNKQKNPFGMKNDPEKKKIEDEQSDNYTEDFEEIDEEIEIESQGTGKESQRYFESGGSSGAVDPSVDSLALDQCDYLEPVKKVRN